MGGLLGRPHRWGIGLFGDYRGIIATRACDHFIFVFWYVYA